MRCVPMPEVKVVNLWKSFGKRVVLKGVNLEVEDGEYFVIVLSLIHI